MPTAVRRLPSRYPLFSGTCLSGLLMACLLLLSLPGLSAEAPAQGRDPRAWFFVQSFGDLPEELAEARQSGKLGLLLFFEQEGCPYCERMLRTVLNQPEVQDWYRARFVPIAIDINGSVELTDVDGVTLPSKVIAEHRRVTTTPVISFIDLQGSEVYRRVSAVNSVDEFLLMGRYVAEGHYQDTSWRDFSGREMQTDEPEDEIPEVQDFREEAAQLAPEGRMLLLAVTRQGCAYCARLRREVLSPMLRSGDYRGRVVIRQMMMEPDTPVIDFAGKLTSTAQLASAYGVTIAPTVLLLDEYGTSLVAPIVGINNADFYIYYLDEALALATAVQASRSE